MDNDQLLLASRYADGEMDRQEQQEFELLMSADAQLRDYVEQYRQATLALKDHFAADEGLNNLKQTLGQLNNTYFKPEAKIISLKTYARWLSGVAAVLIIGLLVFNPWRKSLYDQYSTANTMSVAERGEGPQTNLEKAAGLYNKRAFTLAEPLLAKAYAGNPKNSLAAYYYSITLIEDKKETQARAILQQLFQGESAFKYDAAYYIALSYVKQKDNANAKKWLKNVPPGTSNYSKAKELEEKL